MSVSELDAKRTEAMNIMMEWLLVLRSALNITQGELAHRVGISRQTYSALELGKKALSWNTFLSLFLFFLANEKTRNLLRKKPGYVYMVLGLLRAGEEQTDCTPPDENEKVYACAKETENSFFDIW